MSSVATYPSLVGKTVIVTGGGSGIGESMTRHFALQGASVGFLDISDDPSQALETDLNNDGHNTRYVHCDVTDTEALRAAIGTIRDTFGPIGVLVNNAAHDQRHRLEDVTPQYWDERIAINIKHQFFAAQGRGGGHEANWGGIDHQYGIDLMDDRQWRHGLLHRVKISSAGPDPARWRGTWENTISGLTPLPPAGS